MSSPMVDDELFTNMAGCVSGPLDVKGIAFVIASTSLLYYLYTRPKRVPDEILQTAKYGEGSGRRDFLVVLILQLGAATFRGVSGRQCTAEEIKERNEKVLDAKG